MQYIYTFGLVTMTLGGYVECRIQRKRSKFPRHMDAPLIISTVCKHVLMQHSGQSFVCTPPYKVQTGINSYG